MSAQLTTERRTVKMRRGVITVLGYLYCGPCADKTRQRIEKEHWFTARQDPPWGSWDDWCDGCRRTVDDWPEEDVAGTTVIEHVACKIF